MKMSHKRARPELRWVVDSIAKLQVSRHKINVRHSAATPFNVGTPASNFLFHLSRTHIPEFFTQLYVALSGIKACCKNCFPHPSSDPPTTRDFASLEIRRMLPGRCSFV